MSKGNTEMIEETSYVVHITKESHEEKEGEGEGPSKIKKTIRTETYSQSGFNGEEDKKTNADAGGGIRNKYKKKKGGSSDKLNLVLEEKSTKEINDEKELKNAIIDGIKNMKKGISDEKSNKKKKDEEEEEKGMTQSKTRTKITVT